MAGMELLAHPFRVAPDGSVATVTDGTDLAVEQELARLVGTRKGERVMVPFYGITDPTFDELDLGEINATLALFGPEVQVTGLVRTRVRDTTLDVTLEWGLPDAVD